MSTTPVALSSRALAPPPKSRLAPAISESLATRFAGGGVDDAEKALRELRALAPTDDVRREVLSELSASVMDGERRLAMLLQQCAAIEDGAAGLKRAALLPANEPDALSLATWRTGLRDVLVKQAHDLKMDGTQRGQDAAALLGKTVAERLEVLNVIDPKMTRGDAYGHMLHAASDAGFTVAQACVLVRVTLKTPLRPVLDAFGVKQDDARPLATFAVANFANQDWSGTPDLHFQALGNLLLTRMAHTRQG